MYKLNIYIPSPAEDSPSAHLVTFEVKDDYQHEDRSPYVEYSQLSS